MTKRYLNRAKTALLTTGTAETVTLGAAEKGYQTFAEAGIQDGDQVRYVIEDKAAWEIGLAIYSATGPTLTRGVTESSDGGTRIALTDKAVIFASMAGEDIKSIVDDTRLMRVRRDLDVHAI